MYTHIYIYIVLCFLSFFFGRILINFNIRNVFLLFSYESIYTNSSIYDSLSFQSTNSTSIPRRNRLISNFVPFVILSEELLCSRCVSRNRSLVGFTSIENRIAAIYIFNRVLDSLEISDKKRRGGKVGKEGLKRSFKLCLPLDAIRMQFLGSHEIRSKLFALGTAICCALLRSESTQRNASSGNAKP